MCVWNVSEVAPSTDSDARNYAIVRELLIPLIKTDEDQHQSTAEPVEHTGLLSLTLPTEGKK
jgi:hypothetical protein